MSSTSKFEVWASGLHPGNGYDIESSVTQNSISFIQILGIPPKLQNLYLEK